MKPLLLMRAKGLIGPFFGRYVGARTSLPLAHSAGNFLGSVIRGPELITNGAFIADTDWTKETWTIGSGVANAPSGISGGQRIFQSAAFVESTVYEVKITLSNGSYIGGLSVWIKGTLAAALLADGSYTFPVTAGAAAADIWIFPFNDVTPSNFVGDIDNVSVREIL